MEKCKVCGVNLIHEKGVCSSCVEFFKWKYGKNFKKQLKRFLEGHEKKELNKWRKQWKRRH
jgi:hypothetical protein